MAEHLGQNSFRYAAHHFEWTDLHLPEHKTRHLRHDYDKLGSLVVEKLQAVAKATETPKPERPGPVDLFSVLRDHHHEDAAMEALWTEVHTVPDWVDWEQLERGQKFFYRYAMANLMGFALQGFVGENTASSSVVEVLVRTGGFSIRALRRRLMATFQLILQVTNSIDCLRAGGAGHTTAVRVRLLHSAVRNRIMKLAESKPDYFSVDEFGVPINTLDSIHSIATFCCNHMWLQLPQMGVYPQPQEMADYIALWRYIGYLLATPHEYFDSTVRAKATMESMLVTELRLTPTSDIVCHNFVEFLTDLPPFNISSQFIEAGSRRMNGDKFCDALGFGRPGWYAHACFQGHCWLVRGLALAQQHFPPADRYLTGWFRKNLHQGIIHSRAGLSGGSKFSFKYVPQLGQLTGKETATWHEGKVSFYQRPIELFFFGVFSSVCLTIPLSLCALWQLKRFVFA